MSRSAHRTTKALGGGGGGAGGGESFFGVGEGGGALAVSGILLIIPAGYKLT